MLSKPAKRDLKHNRTIKGKGYKREDGLWDIEVFLIDSKTYSFENMHRGYISSGEPLHDMAVRLTLNDERKIIDIEAVINASPYNICPQAVENCQKLKGEYLIAGFNRKVIKTMGGEKGCRHITDLLAYAGTIATKRFGKKKLAVKLRLLLKKKLNQLKRSLQTHVLHSKRMERFIINTRKY